MYNKISQCLRKFRKECRICKKITVLSHEAYFVFRKHWENFARKFFFRRVKRALKPLHTVGKVSVNASILYKNQEICNKTYLWKFNENSLLAIFGTFLLFPPPPTTRKFNLILKERKEKGWLFNCKGKKNLCTWHAHFHSEGCEWMWHQIGTWTNLIKFWLILQHIGRPIEYINARF